MPLRIQSTLICDWPKAVHVRAYCRMHNPRKTAPQIRFFRAQIRHLADNSEREIQVTRALVRFFCGLVRRISLIRPTKSLPRPKIPLLASFSS